MTGGLNRFFARVGRQDPFRAKNRGKLPVMGEDLTATYSTFVPEGEQYD